MKNNNKPKLDLVVQEPPRKGGSRGRTNMTFIALDFLTKNAKQWCKVFSYPYTDEKSHSTYMSAMQRKIALARLADEYGFVIETTIYNDKEIKAYCVYAMMKEETQ